MQNIFQPSHLKILCEQYLLSPSKQYGQHYLISEKPIEKMIEAAGLTKDDTVVEIGPGFGVLTLAIAPKVKKVVAFEIERKLEGYWEKTLEDLKTERFEDCGDIEIVWGNALKNLSVFKSSSLESYKVLANLPYQITSQALRVVLEAPVKPEIIVVMVQKEVAERICAKAGDMSLLGLSVQYYGAPKIVCDVPRGAFWPMPKVDSAVVAISPYHLITLPPDHMNEAKEEKEFFRIARAGFAHKRKQLWRNLAEGLKIDGDMVKTALRDITENEKVRAEELGIGEWRELVKKLEEIKDIEDIGDGKTEKR